MLLDTYTGGVKMDKELQSFEITWAEKHTINLRAVSEDQALEIASMIIDYKTDVTISDLQVK